MQQVARFESYRDLNFICFDKGVESLSDYLGPVKEYLDVICDQAEMGMTIVGGTQEYSMRANWKLLTENTHRRLPRADDASRLILTTSRRRRRSCASRLRGFGPRSRQGHAVLEYKAPWGRPVAQWIPSWGEEGKRELSRLYDGLVARFGKTACRSHRHL
jgi:p-cumate 2,3-dioxygenase alpha subunit